MTNTLTAPERGLDVDQVWRQQKQIQGLLSGETDWESDVHLLGDVLIGGTLTVTTGLIISGDLTLSARLIMAAPVAKIVGGATSLSLRNNADSADNLLVTNAGDVTVRAGLAVTTTLNVGGISTLGVVNAGAVTGTSLVSSGTLNVAGVSTLGTVNAGVINGTTITGTALFSSGTLNVAGISTLGVVNAGATSVSTLVASSTLNVGGVSTLGAVNAGAISGSSLDSSGTLEVDGISTLFGTVNANAINGTTITGTALVSSGTLGVTGTSTLGAVNAGATSTTTLAASSTLNVTGTSTLGVVNAGATATTTLTASSTLNVTGISTLGVVNAGAVTVTSLATSATPASAGAIRMGSTQLIKSRNTTNSVDIDMIWTDGSNNVLVGAVGNPNNLFLVSGNSTFVYGGSSERFRADATGISWFGSAANAKQTVTGLKGGNAALGSLLSALANYGLITDSSGA